MGSDITDVSLREFFTAQIGSIRELIVAHDLSYQQRFTDNFNATQTALNAAKEAVLKAETANEKRFESMNESQVTSAEQQRSLMPRSEVEILIKNLNSSIQELAKKSEMTQVQLLGMLTVATYESRHAELTSRVEELKNSVTGITSAKAGVSQGWAWAVAGLGFITAIISVLSRFMK